MTTGSSKTDVFLKFLLVALIVVTVVCIAILASVPPVRRDALTHHLAVPKLYLQHGGMEELPAYRFFLFSDEPGPALLDSHSITATISCRSSFILPSSLLTAGLLFSFLKKRLGTPYALIGSLMFLSTPVIVKLSITVYVDLGLVFFSTAALIYLVG